jgi:hypothetical protein
VRRRGAARRSVVHGFGLLVVVGAS